MSPCRLWQHVTRAITDKDQNSATQEKFVLEEAQRQEARERSEKPWTPRLFSFDADTNEWSYKHAEYVHTELLINVNATGKECDLIKEYLTPGR